MGDYFKSRRRKLGVVTLALALLFMGGWIRSLVVDDFYELPFVNGAEAESIEDQTISGLATTKQSLVLYWFSKCIAQNQIDAEPALVPPVQQVSMTSTESESTSDETAGVVFASAPLTVPARSVTLYFEEPAPHQPEPAKKFGDEHLYLLESITGLTRLSLSNTATSEDGLKKLQALTNLNTLLLGDTETTDAGIKNIVELKNLNVLNLGHTKITDAAIADLKQLKNLTCLTLMNTAVTDKGLKDLGGMSQLTELFLGNLEMTDEGLRAISELKQLRELYLTDTNITDAGMKTIGGLSQLQQLDLTGTKITDAGLLELTGLRGLSWICVAKTQVTKAGAKTLKNSLPDLQIDWK